MGAVIKRKPCFFFSFIFLVFSLMIEFSKQKKETNQKIIPLETNKAKKTKHTSLNHKKFCDIKEHCKECTLKELKTVEECHSTGFKLLKHCVTKDDKEVVKDEIFNEVCLEPRNFGSIHLFLLLSIILVVISGYFRIKRKKFKLHSTLEKIMVYNKEKVSTS